MMEKYMPTSLDASPAPLLQECPNCAGRELEIFYEVKSIPVNSVVVIKSKEEALNYPKGDIKLALCSDCGFISNIAFEEGKLEYSQRCEETQGFSATFGEFHKNLAEKLARKYDLFNKTIIEIGCGKGEFLTMLCEIGNNKGIGFDPAYISERNQSEYKDNIYFIEDFYSEKYSGYKADFIVCKMTLEHIPRTFEFLSMIRRSIGDNQNSSLFFQIPDVTRVLKDLGFWDIYYEHCSYFSPVSLYNLFVKTGFRVSDMYTEYDEQYLMIEAVPDNRRIPEFEFDVKAALSDLKEEVSYFSRHIEKYFSYWRSSIEKLSSEGKKIVVWGGGSKAVAFLTTLGITDRIAYIVDINPYKNNSYILGTGQNIVSPSHLQDYQPDIVLVMNPIYMNEIREELASMDLYPQLLPIDKTD